jgi:NosR/NirI family transcriptional regulator, nitrous oxide reductase regulator
MVKQFLKRSLPLLIILISATVVFLQKDVVTEDNCGVSIERIKDFIPEAEKLKKMEETCFFKVYGKSGENLGTVLYENPGEQSPSGFGGKMKVFVVVDGSNRISAIFQGDNNETGSYLALLEKSGFYNRWNGLKISEAFEKDVDSVTGATMSCNAVKGMVKKNLALYKGVAHTFSTEKSGLGIISVAVVIFFVFSIIFFFLPVKTIKLRPVLLVAAVVLPGFISGNFASMEMFGNWLKNGISQGTCVVFIITILSIMITFVKKRNLYCYYFCPMGSLQELLYKIPAPKKSPKPVILKIAGKFRILFLCSIIIIMITGVMTDFSVFEPFSAFQIKVAAISSIVLFTVGAALSIFSPRPWCRLCPTGEVFESVRKFRKPQIPGSR